MFPPAKWAKGLQQQTLGKYFYTTNNNMEVMSAYIKKGLPRGELKFRTALSHLRNRMTRIKIKESGLKKIEEFRNRTSRETTMKRSVRLRITKTLKSIKLNISDLPNQKANIRVSFMLLGKTHAKKKSVTKATFEAWFQAFRGIFSCVISVR